METFSRRLKKAAGAADMTVADLVRWFQRPRPTVNTWLQGRTPRAGPAGRCAEYDLDRLEEAVQRGFVVPARLDAPTRADFVRLRAQEKRYGGRHNGVSKMRPAS